MSWIKYLKIKKFDGNLLIDYINILINTLKHLSNYMHNLNNKEIIN